MQHITSFNESNEYLKSLYGNSRVEYNLDNIKTLVDYLDNPQDRFKVVHVAGTSGKTSTSYFMTALLRAGGQKTGLTVSPIIDEVNERLQIDLRPLEESKFISALNEFINLLSNSKLNPSRFEFLIAFAYWYFANQAVDYGVIEVGLGGLKDATNVMTREDKVCLITDIGFDHMNVLGNTIEEIAAQKAGIILPGNDVFVHYQGDEVMSVINNKVSQVGAKLHIVEAAPNPDADIPDYQHRNWELAYASYKFIAKRDGLSELNEALIADTKHVQVPARMDIKEHRGKTIILDGAHNVQKMTAFIDSFNKLYPNAKPAIMVAMRRGKDYEEVAKLLSPLASQVIATTFESYQDTPLISLPADQLASAFSVPTMVINDPKEALDALLGLREDILVITGSLYLLGQIREVGPFLK
jgi:dihydrofolate synthase/folylpolyglutamate synthase